MSVDSYFCFCCLSTGELTNLFSNIDNTSYADMLNNVCTIKPSQQDYEDDSYICDECAKKLVEAYNFKTKILQTINVLQINGLLQLHKTKDFTLIRKAIGYNVSDETKYTPGIPDDLTNLYPDFDTKTDKLLFTDELQNIGLDITVEDFGPDDTPIKQESLDITSSLNVQPTEEAIAGRRPHHSVPTIHNPTLERVKRITVTKRKKQKECSELVKSESKTPVYRINEDFTCDVCSETSPNLNVYHKHMNHHYPNHICETCGKGFLTLKRLKRHTPSHDTGPYTCETCRAVFTNYNTLNSHRRLKHGTVRLYKCTLCPERFQTFNRRMLHLAAVHGQNERKYKCTMCPSQFLMSGNLSAHIRRTHLKVKRFFCSECDAGFFQKQDLLSHMPLHTGVKEYQCTTCAKSFPRRKALIVHTKIHTNDKRFTCNACGKKFVQKCALQNHLHVHEKEMVATNEPAKEDEHATTLLLETDIDIYSYI